MLDDPGYQRMRRANFCPQIRLRAALQGSDEAVHDVHAALDEVVALLLLLFRMLQERDTVFCPLPPNLLNLQEDCWLAVTLQGDCLAVQVVRPASQFRLRHSPFQEPPMFG